MTMLERIQAALLDFEVDASGSLRAMRQLREEDELNFSQAALMALLSADAGPGYRELYQLARESGGDVLIRLLDPALDAEQVGNALYALCKVDFGADIRLIRRAIQAAHMDDRATLFRVLSILKHFSTVPRLVPLLMQLYRVAPQQAQAQLATMIAKDHQNESWVEQRMQDKDARVRANIVEVFIGSASPLAIEVFRLGINDTAARVVANAALGLYYAGSAAALKFLGTQMALGETAQERAAAAWAMGQSRDLRFRSVLRSQVKDKSGMVRRQAIRALAIIRRHSESRSFDAPVPELSFHVKAMLQHCGPDGNTHYRLEFRPSEAPGSGAAAPLIHRVRPIELHTYQGERGILDYHLRSRETHGAANNYDLFFRAHSGDAAAVPRFEYHKHVSVWTEGR
jgi:HEAT repeat protein